MAPSLFADRAAADRSERYRFVPTIDVIEALRGEGFMPVKVAESRSLSDEGKPFVKHNVRLRRERDIHTKLAVVGQVLPEISLTNSHNGTSGFVLDPALLRLACSNGLIVADSQGQMRLRHSGGEDLAGRIIEGAYELVEDFPRIADKVEAWSSLQLTREQQHALALAALPLRFDIDPVRGDYPITTTQALAPRRYGDSKPDLFTTYNVLQENLVRGGIYAGRKNGRRQTTRQIKSVDTDLRLNRALWTLASEMEKLAA